MSRLIDAEGSDLQTKLKIIREAEYQIYGSGSWGFTAKCEHAIEDAPTVHPEPHWIPCSERLPEVGREILICDIDGDIYVGHRAIEHWWSVDDKVKNVTAWQPLPKPFKG